MIETCDKSDNKSGNSSSRDGDDQGFEAEEDNARLHSWTVRSMTRDNNSRYFFIGQEGAKTADTFSSAST